MALSWYVGGEFNTVYVGVAASALGQCSGWQEHRQCLSLPHVPLLAVSLVKT